VVVDLFADVAADGTAVVMVTHEHDLGGHAHRRITLADGRVTSPSEVIA
jgi:ABC-type lipoprotein export system ATPase subunit